MSEVRPLPLEDNVGGVIPGLLAALRLPSGVEEAVMPAVVAELPELVRLPYAGFGRDDGDLEAGGSLLGEGEDISGDESGESVWSWSGWSSFESGGVEAIFEEDGGGFWQVGDLIVNRS